MRISGLCILLVLWAGCPASSNAQADGRQVVVSQLEKIRRTEAILKDAGRALYLTILYEKLRWHVYGEREKPEVLEQHVVWVNDLLGTYSLAIAGARETLEQAWRLVEATPRPSTAEEVEELEVRANELVHTLTTEQAYWRQRLGGALAF